MLKLLIGPILVGAAYAAGSYYGADADQVVHKSPSTTYAAVEQAIDNMPQSGTTFFEGGIPAHNENKVGPSLDQELVVSLLFNGKLGAQADIGFTPRDRGASTLIITRIRANRSVLRQVLTGTSQSRMAYAPDWMLNLTFKPVLQQLATQIEQGQSAQIRELSEGEAEAQWESSLSDEQRTEVAQWRQYDAVRPATDPNTAAQQYLGGGNASSN